MVSLRPRGRTDVYRNRRVGVVFPSQVDATEVANGIHNERGVATWKGSEYGEWRCCLNILRGGEKDGKIGGKR